MRNKASTIAAVRSLSERHRHFANSFGFLLFCRTPPMYANHLSAPPKGIANYPKGRGDQLFLRPGPFRWCLLLESWTLAQAKFPEYGLPLKLRWALLCRLWLLSKKRIKPKLLLNHNFKSNSDALLPRVPIKCHDWYFTETVSIIL